MLQPPQWSVRLVVLTSQPLTVLPPQLATVVLVLISQPLAALPSQLAKPGLQVPMPQTPDEQPAVALEGAGQALLQAPQWATVVVVGVSQPLPGRLSQLPNPTLHDA